MKRILVFAAVVVLLAFALTPVAGASTLDNLQAAYNGESNANAKYLAFAKKADAEGFKGAASLFRAAANAEKVHAAEHATVIKSMGATPVAKIELPPVGTTAENLAAAVKGESYERDTMYPQFIAEAKNEGNKKALRAFNLAKTAEAEHARLYTEAGNDLPSMKQARTYYVCQVCGYTTTSLDFTKCISCFAPKDRYTKVA